MARLPPGVVEKCSRPSVGVAADSNDDSNEPGRGQRPAAARVQSPELTDADGHVQTKRLELRRNFKRSGWAQAASGVRSAW